MMKSAEKISKPSASFSLNPKQMHESRFGPRSFEPMELEREAPADTGMPHFSYNLLNMPACPPVQHKEREEEEELLQSKIAKTIQRQPEEEEEKLQSNSIGDCIAANVQRLANPDAKEEEILQGKFLMVQRKVPHFSYNLTNIPAYPPSQKQTQAKPNRTGMPDQLKAGIESFSGIDISDIRVHTNSDKPACLNALAYAQGNQIYLGPGQE